MGRKKKLGAGYRERTDGRIEYRWTDSYGKRHSVIGRDLEDCEKKFNERKEEIERGSYVSNEKLTLSDLYEEYVLVNKGNVKEATVLGWRKKYRRITATGIITGDTKVRSIEKRMIELVQQKMLDGYEREAHRPNGKVYIESGALSTGTVNNTLAFLHALLERAVENDVIDKNPAQYVKSRKRPKTEILAKDSIHKAFTQIELNALFAKAKAENYFYLPLFQLLVKTGMRCGEAAALTYSDIDAKNHIIHVTKTVTFDANGVPKIGDTPKTGEQRDLDIDEDVLEILHRQKQLHEAFFGNVVHKTIFVTTSGSLVQPSIVNDSLRRLCRRAEVEERTVHSFRDTYATLALQQGAAPKAVAAQLGHKSLKMIMELYGQVQDAWKKKELAKVKISI